MKQKTQSSPEPATATLAATLSAREVRILCRRLGIDPDETNENEIRRLFKLPPTGGGDQGQGGAPLNAAESFFPSTDEDGDDGLSIRHSGHRRRPH